MTQGADQRTASDPLWTVCAACATDVRMHVEVGTAVAPDGREGRITYVDSVLVVWDCPACLYTNADTFGGD